MTYFCIYPQVRRHGPVPNPTDAARVATPPAAPTTIRHCGANRRLLTTTTSMRQLWRTVRYPIPVTILSPRCSPRAEAEVRSCATAWGTVPIGPTAHRRYTAGWRSRNRLSRRCAAPPPTMACERGAAYIPLGKQLTFFNSVLVHLLINSITKRSHRGFLLVRTQSVLGAHFCIPFLGIARPQSQFPHSCLCERFI